MIATSPARKPLVVKPRSHLLVRAKAIEERGQARRARRHRRVERDARDALSVERRQRAARVEAVPAEPEDQAADRAEDDVVRQRRTAAVAREDAAEPRTERDGAGERDGAADACGRPSIRRSRGTAPAITASQPSGPQAQWPMIG